MSSEEVAKIRQDIAVLTTMFQTFKDETFPTSQRATANGLLAIHRKIEEHGSRITALENYKVGHTSELGVWKWIAGFAGIGVILEWIRSLLR